MVVSGLLAFLLVVSVLHAREKTVQVAVALRDIPVGAQVPATAVRWVEIPADSTLKGSLVRASGLRGRVVAAQPIAKGEPLTKHMLRAPGAPSGLRAMSIPVAPEHSSGGDLEVGDRVDVIDVNGTYTSFVVRDAEVVGIGSGRSGGFTSGGGGGRFITIAVNGEDALRLAFALADNKIDVVRATGAAPLTSSAVDFGTPAEGQ
jgi:Flp pilus assembly protein CpaB